MLTLKQTKRKLGKQFSHNENIGMGTIIIPDISGFNRLVHGTDIQTGKIITKELLTSIIESNMLQLKISEIEGDAILFYRCNYKATQEELLVQYEIMLREFMLKLTTINAAYGIELDLSLKMIAHYGELSEYNINGFNKLYGTAVVDAHELLKNNIESESYVLLTENLVSQNSIQKLPNKDKQKKILDYLNNKARCLTYFEYDKNKWNKATKI